MKRGRRARAAACCSRASSLRVGMPPRQHGRVSLRRAAGPHALHGRRGSRCVLCVVRRCGPAPGRGAAGAYRRRRDRKPAPLSVERRPRRRDPATAAGPVPLGVALMSILSVGDASTRRAASKDTGLAPHQRRQRDLEHRLVVPGERRHRPGGLRSDCGCPTTRTYQSVRAQTWPKLGGTHRLVARQPCVCAS